MARPLNDSPYLYGLHDQGGEQVMAERGIHGWILFTEALGNDPNDQGGRNYSQWADQGFGIMVRLNNGYEPHGTIPYSNRYAEFASRCANFVRASAGCHIWIIGNEMNIPVERPGVQFDRSQNPPRLAQAGEVILPGLYVSCYRRCREAIRAVPGHAQDQVVVGAVAPWNNQTAYDGNPNGDWIQYFEDVLKLLSPDKCDGIAIHTYTHGSDPKMVYSDAFMNPPFQKRQYNFRTYQDFVNAIPRSMRSLPVYLTETDQDDAWANTNNGWVQRAYGEIDWWNKQPGNQVIRAVILYRWSKADKWAIDGRAGVIDDFKQAMQHRYNWETALQAKTGTVIQPEKPKTEVTTPVVEPTKPQVETPVVIDTTPIKFDLTGKTAKGLFAAFYRKYGLDVTGYPISEEYVATDSNLKTQDWQRLSMEEYQGAIRLRLAGQEALALRQQLQTLNSDKVTLGQQLQSYAKEKATLTQQVQTLTATNTSLGQQVSAAAMEKQTLTRKLSDLEARITQLQSGINTGGTTPTQPAGAPMPAITDLVDKLPRHATLKYDTRPLSQITHIAIHHSAAPANVTPERIAAYHVGKDWPAMGYHFYVGPDGTIYQCERLETISYQVYKQNHYSMGICVAGSFVNGAIPTAKQIEAVGDLVAWLTQKLNVPIKNVWGHKEFPENQTACPGNDWNTGKKWKQMVLDRANAVLAGKTGPSAKSIGHYMLFWQRADSWAQEDWAAAAGYFARFRPTAGFSAEDAKNAEYVTIVGGVAGVPYETEQTLAAAGCKVERLSGVDFNDTKRMLDELASTGKRFRTFNV